MDGAPEAILEQIPYIWKVNAIHPTFAQKLGLRVMLIALSLEYLLTSEHRKLTASR